MMYSLDNIKHAVAAVGGHYFDPEWQKDRTIRERFYEKDVYPARGGAYFIKSELWSGRRRYYVCFATDDGGIYQQAARQFWSLKEARECARMCPGVV